MRHTRDPAPADDESGRRPDQAETASAEDEWLLDEALQETFPASDAIAPASVRKPGAPRPAQADPGDYPSKK